MHQVDRDGVREELLASKGRTDPRKDAAPNVDSNKFRRIRFARFIDILKEVNNGGNSIKVLDIGGTIPYWEGLREFWEPFNLKITILNIGADSETLGDYTLIGGDACNTHLQDMSFDIVHSNSVIEHVGDYLAIGKMAAEVRRLAPRYYLQTPNFWFPVEPHYRAIFFQFLPKFIRAKLLMRYRFGFRARALNMKDALDDVNSINLLTRRQMKKLFPDATIEYEKFFGLNKSLIAIK